MCCRSNCGCIEAIFSILLGVALAALYYFTLLPFITILIWIAFALAVVALLAVPLAATSKFCVGMPCLCNYGMCILIGAAGTFLSAIALLIIDISIPAGALVANLAPTIVLFVFGTFFFFLLMAIVLFLACLLKLACCK